ncbi:MAG: hypothetical protein ACOYU4_06735 [Thermodesulfobacteriota bacterium]
MKRILPIVLAFILLAFSTSKIYAEDIGGGTFVLRSYEYLKDGTIKLGALFIEIDQNTKEAKIEVTQFDSKRNGVNKWLTVSELSKKPVGVTEYRLSDDKVLTKDNLYFGVSEDKQLIIIVKADNNSINVIRDFKGNYDVQDLQGEKPVTIVKGVKLKDGRIKLP